MAKQTVGRTALGAAICRLIEQYQPEKQRLFNDPVVKDLIGTAASFMMKAAAIRQYTVQQTDGVMVGLYGAQVCRTRYIDDAVQVAIAQGVEQLVVLGAGFDTRPYRLNGIERVKVFEVDLPEVQAEKKKRLSKALGRLPERVTFIPIDFDRQSLDEVFGANGFDRSKPAVFIWEGVTQYLTQPAVVGIMRFVGKSAAGSIFVFTYVLKSIIERRSDIPGAEKMVDFVARTAPWLFGIEPGEVGETLRQFGMELVEDVGNADYQERYLRPLGRTLVVSEAERIAKAKIV